ncbi:hypothetical protein D3C77_703240 [compost metagenome]
MLQLITHFACPMGRGIGLGRYPSDGLEHPVKVERAHVQLLGQLVEAGCRLGTFDQLAGTGNLRSMLFGHQCLVGRPPFAGAVTRCLGLRRGVEELDIVDARQP